MAFLIYKKFYLIFFLFLLCLRRMLPSLSLFFFFHIVLEWILLTKLERVHGVLCKAFIYKGILYFTFHLQAPWNLSGCMKLSIFVNKKPINLAYVYLPPIPFYCSIPPCNLLPCCHSHMASDLFSSPIYIKWKK